MWLRGILYCALLLFTSITLAEQTAITIDNEEICHKQSIN